MPVLPALPLLAALGGGVAALVVCALLASNTSASLVSPLPPYVVVPGLLLWIALVAGIVIATRTLSVPLLVRRLLALALFSASGWSLGTLARAAWVTVAFALADEVDVEDTVWQVLGFGASGGGARSLPVNSVTLNRTVSIPFDEDAVAEIEGSLTCLTLPLVSTESGVARVVVPDEPLGVDDLESCPAVRYIGR